jgi:putative ABC transport system permease protein
VTGDQRVGAVVVSTNAKGAAAQSDVIQRLRETLGANGFDVASAQSMDANRHVVEDHLLMVAGFLLIMSQLIIVVGGLGLASTMSLSVLERTREIGVLRAIGASHTAILTMVQVEGLVIGVLSWVIAIPLSLPMSVILGRAFGKVMFPVPVSFVPEISGVGLWLAVVIGVTVLACAWPAARAMRITTREALVYE